MELRAGSADILSAMSAQRERSETQPATIEIDALPWRDRWEAKLACSEVSEVRAARSFADRVSALPALRVAYERALLAFTRVKLHWRARRIRGAGRGFGV